MIEETTEEALNKSLKETSDYKYALEAQQALFASIINSSDDAILSKTLDGIVTSWNKGAEKVFGYTAKEIIGKQISVLIPAHLQNEEKEIIKKISKGEFVKHYETERIKKDGKVIPVSKVVGLFGLHSDKVNFFDEDEIKLLEEAAGDISFGLENYEKERQHNLAAALVLRNEIRLKESQALAHIGNWEVNLSDNSSLWSDELYDIYGIKSGEVPPSPALFLSFMHPDDAEFAQKEVQKVFETSQPASFNFRFIRKDGAVRHAHTDARFELDKNNKPIRLYGIVQDVTEAKLAEEEREKITADLLQRNKDLEQFTYIVSHNLRAPVANIMGTSEALRTMQLDENEKEDMMHSLSASVMKLNGVILDLNNILQIKRNLSEKREVASFSHLIKNIKISIDDQIKKEQVEIITDFSEVDKMETLKSYLYSVFYNLISNSIKYKQPEFSPVIKIKSYKMKDKIEIHYSDNGLGIDMNKRGEQVFGLYKRFHTHIEGKGMGLFMTKTQVEALGGTISLESEVNKGTKFIISFPQ